MPYPTADEFEELLFNQPLEELVRNYIFGGAPYAFRHRPKSSQTLIQHLCREIRVHNQDVAVVGSAKIGFSLSPYNFPRRFSWRSDIDVVIVDEELFDRVWFTMLRWNYPRRLRLEGTDWDWSKRRIGELYWGWFVPDQIGFEGLSFPEVLKPLRDVRTTWFNAFQSLSLYPELSGRDIEGRLYRSWDHALLYHMDGLTRIKTKLEELKKGRTR